MRIVPCTKHQQPEPSVPAHPTLRTALLGPEGPHSRDYPRPTFSISAGNTKAATHRSKPFLFPFPVRTFASGTCLHRTRTALRQQRPGCDRTQFGTVDLGKQCLAAARTTWEVGPEAAGDLLVVGNP